MEESLIVMVAGVGLFVAMPIQYTVVAEFKEIKMLPAEEAAVGDVGVKALLGTGFTSIVDSAAVPAVKVS